MKAYFTSKLALLLIIAICVFFACTNGQMHFEPIAILTIFEGSTYNFGNYGVGVATDHSFLISNTGAATATISPGSFISSGAFSYKFGNYPGFGGTCGATLDPGAKCFIVVSFAPTSAISYQDILTLNYSSYYSNSISCAITGTGVNGPTLAITTFAPQVYSEYHIHDNPTFDFGTVGIGQIAGKYFAVTNNGNSTVTGLTISPGNLPFVQFPVTQPSGLPACGSTLLEGSTNSCAVFTTFIPTAIGSYSSSLVASGTGVTSNTLNYIGSGTNGASLALYDYSDQSSAGLLIGGVSGIDVFPGFYYYSEIGSGTSLDHSFLVTNLGSATATSLSSGNMPNYFNFKNSAFPGGQSGTSVNQLGSNVTYCGSSLAAGASCGVTITYSPTSGSNPGQATGGIANISYFDGANWQSAGRQLYSSNIDAAILYIANGNGGGPDTVTTFGGGNSPVPVASPTPTWLLVQNLGSQTATNITPEGTSNIFYFSSGAYPGGSGTYTSQNQTYNFCDTSLESMTSCLIGVTFNPSSAQYFYTNFGLQYQGGNQTNTFRGLDGTGCIGC